MFEVQTPEWIRGDIDTLIDDVEETEFTSENISRIRDLESKIEMGLDMLVILIRSNSVNPTDKLMYEAYVQSKRKDLSKVRNELIGITPVYADN